MNANLRACPLLRLLWFLLVSAACGAPALAATQETNAASALRAKYASIAEQLGSSAFHRPLILESVESDSTLRGDVYALLEHPFALVSGSLDSAQEWCDVMILHINTKSCQASTDRSSNVIAMRIGKKTEQVVEDTYRVDFAFRVTGATPEYLGVRLNADAGPLGTRDYRILVEAVSLEGGRTFLHFTYSYGYGFAARVAMQAYLATLGSGKVGFTVVGNQSNGQPDFIGGTRGVVERNTMRYYLAIDAYLAALAAPPGEQFERRLQIWFTSTERYARQLHEVDRSAYLEMKRRDYARQQTLLQGARLGAKLAR